jgi:hypothetical protein
MNYVNVDATTNSVEKDLPLKDIILKLSQTVLAQNDKEIKRAFTESEQYKIKLEDAKTQLRERRKKIEAMALEEKKLQLKTKIIDKLNTLRKEGVVKGKNKQTILKLLETIDNQSIESLMVWDERISTYTPDTPRITYG